MPSSRARCWCEERFMQDQFRIWLPIVISGVALAVTAVLGWTTQTDRRAAAQLAKEAAQLAKEKDLHTWAKDIGNIYVSLLVGDVSEKKKSLGRLSVMVDYGRLLFPNERSERALREYSKGRRSSVLDPLVETCKRSSHGDWSEAKLSKDWREFTDQLSNRTTAFAIDTSPEAEGTPQYRNP